MEGARYAFILDYFDRIADKHKEMLCLVFPDDGSLSLRDMTTRKNFLKRTKYPLTLDDFRIGATITIHSRQMQVIRYADKFTENIMSKNNESCVFMLKPSGIKLLGKLLSKLDSSNLQVNQIRSLIIPPDFPQFTEEDLTNEKVIVGEVLGADAVSSVKLAAEALGKTYGVPASKFLYHSLSTKHAGEDKGVFFGGKMKFSSGATFENATCCVVKPHLVKERNLGKVLETIHQYGFDVEALNMLHLEKSDVEDFLEVYKGVVPFYKKLVEEFSSGYLVAMEVKRTGCSTIVETFRDACGPEDPEIAKKVRPKSLRAIFGVDEVCSGIHATVLERDALNDLEFFFRIMI